jgi:hypothetical protein
MALKLNLSQINSASGGNQAMRETLTGIYNELRNIYARTGGGPIRKIDSGSGAARAVFQAPPPPSQLTVTGANGSFLASIALPQSASGAGAPQNAANAPIYQQISSSPAADFRSGVTTYPVSTATSYVFPNPGQTLYWRLRSSWDQKNWNSFVTLPGAVSSGRQSSAATENNLSLNQSNFATIDSVAAGDTATVRIYGSGGPGSSWARVAGSASQTVPGGTVLNVAYGANLYVAWDGAQYQTKPALTQTFPDGWVPVGKVSVIANGSGLVLPTFKLFVSSGAVIAIQILTAGNGLTAAPSLTIADSTGTGATAACTVSAGSVNGASITNSGSGYSASPSIAASGGVAAGSGGGGGPQGNNGGRLYADV